MRSWSPSSSRRSSPCCSHLAGLSGAVRGFLRDTGGRPLAFANVVAVSADGADAGETLPRSGAASTVLIDVPEGVYTLVILQGTDEPIRAARDPVRIAGGGNVAVEVDVGAGGFPR